MIKYENANWHHDAANGDDTSMHLHMGFYIAWLANKKFLESELQSIAKEVIDRKITGCQFFQSIDGKLSSEELTSKGNKFTEIYYDGYYFSDYENFAGGKNNFYKIADTWENYEKVAEFLDQRFSEWENGKLKEPFNMPSYLFYSLSILLIAAIAIFLGWMGDHIKLWISQ